MIIDQKVKKRFEGVYLIDRDIEGTKLATTVKPNMFRRFMVWLLLGWQWIDNKKMKELQKNNN